MRRRNRNLFACVNHEFFLSRRPKFYFVTNHPTALTQKTGRENQLSSPLSGFSPTAQFRAKPHLVGNRRSLYPTYCGDKENFQKSCWNDVPKQNRGNLRVSIAQTTTCSPR
jgi:hypothetical protein